MVIDFSKLDLKKQPVLLLCDGSGTPIQYLGYAFNVEAELHYNETSSLSFDYPAFVDGEETPHYKDISGMHEVLWKDVGYFILTNPEESNDGSKRIKSCKAYSAEYEFTYKQITFESGTYDFYDPIKLENTVMGRIMELMPSWHIGEVDSSLTGKYRTFDSITENAYNFIKGTVQDIYQCIFDFDVLNREVSVRCVDSSVSSSPVYLSTKNLAKEIKIEEQTEDIFTCLDVSGADGVNIRTVNPLGTNKIYDLSYFMTESNVGTEIKKQYDSWNAAYEASRLPYFNTSIEMVIEQSRLANAEAKLTTLKGELGTLQSKLSAEIDIQASGSSTTDNTASIKQEISKKEDEIADQEGIIEVSKKKVNDFLIALKKIKDSLAFKEFFNDNQLKTVNKFIKESAIQESSFVVPSVNTYTTSDRNENVTSGIVEVKKSKVMVVITSNEKEIFSFKGGDLLLTVNRKKLSSSIISGVIERSKSDNSFVFTAYLNDGEYDKASDSGSSFPSGCVSITGTCTTTSHDCIKEATTGAWSDGTAISCSGITGYFYLTENATEYQRRSVEWDLLDYGMEVLRGISWPSYTFSVDSCNFLVPEDFVAFRNSLKFGQKIYLDIGDRVIEPILIGCTFSFEDLSDLKLEFGDKYNCRDARFNLADLLDKSISMGKSVDLSKYNYNAFVDSGASNSVLDFMQSALDASKNAVLAGADQAITLDQTGLRLRKSDGNGGFLPEQIWAINNNIVFTDDDWDTAKMAIGKFTDENLGSCWGVVAPNIVGTLLAGNNLVIESAKRSGQNAVFRVDAKGAQLHNAEFDLIQSNGRITLYPGTGLVGGISTASSPLFTFDANGDISGVATVSGDQLTSVSDIDTSDLPNANFWLDMNGNAYFKGKVFATDGEFTGTLKAATITGGLTATDGSALKGISLGIGPSPNYNNFVVDKNGNLNIGGGKFKVDSSGNVTMNGNITWAVSPVQYQFSSDNTSWHSTMQSTDKYRRDSIDGGKTWGTSYQFRGEDGSDANVPNYITSTGITQTSIESPTISGNNIIALNAFNIDSLGYLGKATGKQITEDGNSSESTTYGIAMIYNGSATNGIINYDSTGNYVIVTSAGVRMTYNNGSSRHELTVTKNGCFADGNPIGTGTAVWG